MEVVKKDIGIDRDQLKSAFITMCTAKTLTELYEENFKVVSKYVHATSRGHEAIQIATGMQLGPQDYLAPYYRDDAFLLSIGMTPYDLMLQLLAKKSDPFSGGRSYYSHPSLRDDDKPKIPHQSSATGMQAIPTTGVAMGIQYRELMDINKSEVHDAVVVCSLGDASVTEGEVAEAFQMAALKQFPIIFLIQDNGWDISANAAETRAQNAAEYAAGFHGIETRSIDGSNFEECYRNMKEVIGKVRTERRPFLVHATVPLLNHHTSGVRKEWYRDDLDEHRTRDPYPKLINLFLDSGFTQSDIDEIEQEIKQQVQDDYERAHKEPSPEPSDLFTHDFAPYECEEEGTREPENGEETVMVDAGLHAIQELMYKHPECLLYGQDVGGRLGGVFREAATLAQKFGDERVFNTPIQEAFIVGSTVGMSAVGLKPIVEVQFADYIWPGLNQLFTEVSRSCYLSDGKWPVSMILRVPIGAYGSGGPYHSSSVESILTNIRGIKIAYPSNCADFKGLLKAAYYDPNPVVFLEHKGLYWSKVPGTNAARTIEPAEDYVLPFGKAAIPLLANDEQVSAGNSVLVVSYGMGVHWALNAAKELDGNVEVLDLRTLYPLDMDKVYERAQVHSKVLVLTEEPSTSGFAQSIASRIQQECFQSLDAPVTVLGAENVPAIPLNENLERAYLPNAEKVKEKLEWLLGY